MKAIDYDMWLSLITYAKLMGDLGLYTDADRYFGEAVRNATTYSQRAYIYYVWSSMYQDTRAVELLEMALRYHRPDERSVDELGSWIHYFLSINLRGMGQLEEAKEHANLAKALHPSEFAPDLLEDLEDFA